MLVILTYIATIWYLAVDYILCVSINFVIQKEKGLRREHVRDSEENTERRKKLRDKLLERSMRRIKEASSLNSYNHFKADSCKAD